MRFYAALSTLTLLAACNGRCDRSPTANADATAPTDAKPAKSGCSLDDGSGRPLPKSDLPDALDATVAAKELRGLNSICGDTWCEGRFEFHFHDLRCDPASSTCHVGMRIYPDNPIGDGAATVNVTGPKLRARVIGHAEVPRCVPPCQKGAFAPCEFFDARCELQVPKGAPDFGGSWFDAVSDCVTALEKGIEAAGKKPTTK